MPKGVLPPKLAELLEGGNKIAAINELRGITGLGLAAIVLAAIFLAGCGAMPASEADTRLLLARQADAWDKALIAKDRAGIEANMAPEFVQMRGSGQLVGREQFIRDVTDPGFSMDPYRVEDWEARLFGDTALVYGRIRMSGLADGQRWAVHFRYIDTYVRRNGRWQVVSVQITPMPKEP